MAGLEEILTIYEYTVLPDCVNGGRVSDIAERRLHCERRESRGPLAEVLLAIDQVLLVSINSCEGS